MLNLTTTRKKANALLAQYNIAHERCQIEQTSLDESKTHLENVLQAQTIAQEVSQDIQQKAHQQIAGVVRECLRTVFGGLYSFKINFEMKRGRTEAQLILIKDGHEIEDPLEADSGGVLDIASFALRLACLVLSKPQLRKMMVLDEPFKNLSAGYRDNARQLLEKLAEDFEMQFLMVTHEDQYHIGKVIQL